MSKVIQFPPTKKKGWSTDGPDNAAFCCPTCSTCFWHLRMDYLCECQNGHVFEFVEWDFKVAPSANDTEGTDGQ